MLHFITVKNFKIEKVEQSKIGKNLRTDYGTILLNTEVYLDEALWLRAMFSDCDAVRWRGGSPYASGN